MKKLLLKLAMLLIIVGFCVPAYAQLTPEYLIYKMKGKTAGLVDMEWTPGFDPIAKSGNVNYNGICILEFDAEPDPEHPTPFIDRFNGRTIMVVTKVHGNNVSYLTEDMMGMGRMAYRTNKTDREFHGVEYVFHDGTTLGAVYLEDEGMGKAKPVNIGLEEKVIMAKKIKGTALWLTEFGLAGLPGPISECMGKTIMELRQGVTKDVNKADPSIPNIEAVFFLLQNRGLIPNDIELGE